jgi:hypothetical protein
MPVLISELGDENKNEKFWEVLIVYFPSIDTDRIGNEKIWRDTLTNRQQGDLISLVTKIIGAYINRRTDREDSIMIS